MRTAERKLVDPREYIPALRFHWLTPLYDAVLGGIFPEAEIKRQVAVRAARAERRLLDLGCGTGTLAILLRQTQAGGLITGVDIDGAMLFQAQRKAQRSHTSLALVQGRVEVLPHADGSFDTVVSSLVLHHLNRPQKLAALREAHRVLRVGGELHIADFGPPDTFASRLVSHFTRLFEEVADNIDGLLPELMASAGFERITVYGRIMTVMGVVTLLQGGKIQ
jgi:ubiquinone/menaquinone biosynthesis C-methylase UbiE